MTIKNLLLKRDHEVSSLLFAANGWSISSNPQLFHTQAQSRQHQPQQQIEPSSSRTQDQTPTTNTQPGETSSTTSSLNKENIVKPVREKRKYKTRNKSESTRKRSRKDDLTQQLVDQGDQVVEQPGTQISVKTGLIGQKKTAKSAGERLSQIQSIIEGLCEQNDQKVVQFEDIQGIL